MPRSRPEKTVSITFQLDPTVAGVWRLDVLEGLEVKGHIKRRSDTHAYVYYRGATNNMNASFENHDLDVLKKMVTQNP